MIFPHLMHRQTTPLSDSLLPSSVSCHFGRCGPFHQSPVQKSPTKTFWMGARRPAPSSTTILAVIFVYLSSTVLLHTAFLLPDHPVHHCMWISRACILLSFSYVSASASLTFTFFLEFLPFALIIPGRRYITLSCSMHSYRGRQQSLHPRHILYIHTRV